MNNGHWTRLKVWGELLKGGLNIQGDSNSKIIFNIRKYFNIKIFSNGVF